MYLIGELLSGTGDAKPQEAVAENQARPLPRLPRLRCRDCGGVRFVCLVHIVTSSRHDGLLSCSRLFLFSSILPSPVEVRMKFATGSSTSLIAVSALAAFVQAEDALYSKRMVKRGIDAEGNYNICKPRCGDSDIAPAHAI